ncbi:hypothetical protein MARPO_0054s0009 [Marchantia polymorpha]|uniref:Uncharacterized protein n=1 Tax=Marchantia polymorpha TaxID=3197 RepID=A0A2R6WVK9_MARPO|nr:hypothetical protein MARPO_0054s0009 [Marchantia polymorpha]|eukprot:PTQ37891.1 hypothetical protein MARPO_0054s0009 [Marchantia polymorpha]
MLGVGRRKRFDRNSEESKSRGAVGSSSGEDTARRREDERRELLSSRRSNDHETTSDTRRPLGSGRARSLLAQTKRRGPQEMSANDKKKGKKTPRALRGRKQLSLVALGFDRHRTRDPAGGGRAPVNAAP